MRPPIDDVTPEAIQEGLTRARESISTAAGIAGRVADDVTIVAAVKYVDADACAAMVAAGIRDIAESRYEQLVQKQDAGVVPASARWHWIGRLQSRQAASIAQRAAMLHTLCTDSAARRLAGSDESCDVLVQVNVDGDPAKDGLAPADVERFLAELPEPIVVAGFMAMPAFTDDPERSRPAFAALRELRDRLAPRLAGRHPLHALSIGTSQDFVVAVEEGATHVRLGRILYARGE